MSGSVSRNLVSGVSKAVSIEIRLPGGRGLVVTDSCPQVRANHVRSLIAIGEKRARHLNGNWLSALESDESVEGPATYDRICNAVHPTADPATAAKGKIVNYRHGEAVGGIIGADSVFRFQIVEDLRVVKLQIADPGIRSRGRIIRRFRESVVALDTQIVAGTLLAPDLQRVIPGIRRQQRQPGECPVELRIWPKQVQPGNLGIVINGVGLIKNGLSRTL